MRVAWNKGLTKETDSRVKKYGESGSVSRRGKPSPRRIYSFNPDDWRLECDDCGGEIVYSDRPTYVNACRRKNKSGIKCRSCGQTGKVFSKETRKKMSKAKMGNKNPNKLLENRVKISKTLTGHKRYKENPGPNLGRKFSIEWRKNISDTLKKRNIYPPYSPNYNPKSIPIIEELGKKLGCNFQHAENGGEIRIERFSVDGCDVDKKIIVEIDEKHHFNSDGTYKERDIKRQKYLENLGYKVIRIRI